MRLFLPNHSISDLTPLKKLRRITVLNLAANPIRDIYPLYGLTQIKYLTVSNITGITDYPWLQLMSQLIELDLGHSGIRNIAFLERLSLKNVKMLWLDGNNITNIEPLWNAVNDHDALTGSSSHSINLVGNDILGTDIPPTTTYAYNRRHINDLLEIYGITVLTD